MTKLWPSLLSATQVVQPETILRWHRAGFKVFWRWKSRPDQVPVKSSHSIDALARTLVSFGAKWLGRL
jgi:hypothetical protein